MLTRYAEGLALTIMCALILVPVGALLFSVLLTEPRLYP